MGRGTVKWCDAVKGIGFRALDRDGNAGFHSVGKH
ncbi:cold shock CspA family protein [Pseudomonas sp. W4I3]|nr:cold shock CspA family protein [Pseudomonas sp. W4I3]